MCINDTAAPTATAWRTRPPAPTRYAAISVFPWPGAIAWSAPKPIASRNENATIGTVSPVRSISAANEPPITPGRAPEESTCPEETTLLTPGANENVASVTCSGLCRRLAGYARSSSLIELTGTEEFRTASPSAPSAVISRQPMWSA